MKRMLMILLAMMFATSTLALAGCPSTGGDDDDSAAGDDDDSAM